MKLLAFILAASTLAGIGSANAQRLNYPYCAVYDRGTVSCAFDTMAQCHATVSGRSTGYCEVNFDYRPPAKAKARRTTG